MCVLPIMYQAGPALAGSPSKAGMVHSVSGCIQGVPVKL